MGERITALRKPAGYKTQRALATRLGVSDAFLSDIVRGVKNPSLEMLCELAKLLNTTTDYLLLLTDSQDTISAPTLENGDPVYFSPEADQMARYVDAAPPFRREIMLAVIEAIASTAPGAVEYGAGQTAEQIALSLRASGLVIGDDAIRAIRAEVLRFLTGAAFGSTPPARGGSAGSPHRGGDTLAQDVLGNNGGNRRG